MKKRWIPDGLRESERKGHFTEDKDARVRERDASRRKKKEKRR